MAWFEHLPLRTDAFSPAPFNIVRAEDKPAFNLLMEILLLETGDPFARDNWQKAQVRNLLNHARSRSTFWRERIETKKGTASSLSKLPPLTRADVNRQVQAEGALVSARDNVEVLTRNTSGSTGSPVRFHATQANAIYNEIRSFAQYLIDGRDLSGNRCRLLYDPRKPGYSFTEDKSFAGPLSRLFQTGSNAELGYFGAPFEKVASKLKAYKTHYLVCLPQILEQLLSNGELSLLRKFETRMVIAYGQATSAGVRKALADLGIAHASTYSCEEVGPIATECPAHPGHFHVVESNVIVEHGDATLDVGGETCRNVLVTGLHSYATPFIRYDVGDFAQLKDRCPCGRQGAVITRLVGRTASTLKLPDGTRRPFFLAADFLQEIAPYKDLRARQVSDDKVRVEIVAPGADEAAREKLIQYIRKVCGDSFQVEVGFPEAIDWGNVSKKESFLCEI